MNLQMLEVLREIAETDSDYATVIQSLASIQVE